MVTDSTHTHTHTHAHTHTRTHTHTHTRTNCTNKLLVQQCASQRQNFMCSLLYIVRSVQ